MADFRRLFYAFALVALLAGLTVPASAQGTNPFQCVANAGVTPTIRAEGWTEEVGDIILACTGGTPTIAGQVVQPVTVSVSISTNLTSRLLSGGLWSEALLIVDEPHSTVNPGRNILNCGNVGAADTGPSGSNVCAIVATPDPSHTYDGQGGGYGGTGFGATFANTACPLSGNLYSCGRPNVFQGRIGTPQDPNQYNSVTWLGLPLDPPGTTTNRTIRITNIRADAHTLGISAPGNFFVNSVQAQISINGSTSLSFTQSQLTVAYVATGLLTSISKTNFNFLQCVGENTFDVPPFGTLNAVFSSPNGSQTTGSSPQFTWSEGFGSSWKAKNIAHILSSADANAGNGNLSTAASYWSYDGFVPGSLTGTVNYPKDFNQNVPGAIYNTESGFMYPGASATLDSGALDPPTPTGNPPFGTGTGAVTSVALALHNGTLIDNAGIADAGTRLQVQISNIPAGAFVMIPDAIYLHNGTTNGATPPVQNNSGIAVLTATASDGFGDGPYAPIYTGASAAAAVTTFSPLPASGMAVYEVLFSDPFSLESAVFTAVVAYSPALNLNQPNPTTIAQVFGGFAPFYSSASAHEPEPLSATLGPFLPVPRFSPGQSPANPNFFEINKCACNLLFPFVSAQAGYDTGIAIANTSMDNLGVNGLSAAGAQFGGVQFWYYGTGNNGGTAPPSQCTNTASPGTCPANVSATNPLVSAGQILTYVLSSGGGSIGANPNGLDNRANGFAGYIIAQAQFQYCHAYAFITAVGAGPLSQAVSEGYLGLILDNASWNSCPLSSTGNTVKGLCRTGQSAENLVH